LCHACDCKKYGLVAHWNCRAARHEGVIFIFKKLDEFLADLAALHFNSNEASLRFSIAMNRFGDR